MNLKSGIVCVLFLFWGGLCWQWYTCNIKGFCIFNSNTKEVTAVTNYSPPFTFNKSSFKCILGKKLDNYIDSLNTLINQGEKITIIGLYDSSEKNKSNFVNLGIARAIEIKHLLCKYLDSSKIRIKSESFNNSSPVEPFIAHLIEIEIPDAGDSMASSGDSYKMTKDELNDFGKLITFGENSVKRDASAEVDSFISLLASQLILKRTTITITGHTDNTEDQKLGRIRAWVIKKELLQKGIKSSQLITSSKGSSEPVADNKTAEGRHANRRVVIK